MRISASHCRRATTLIALALALAQTAATSRSAADKLGPEHARSLVELRHILPLEEILKRNAPSLVDARIVELELERDQTGYLYKIKVLLLDGRYGKLRIDATTGDLLGRK